MRRPQGVAASRVEGLGESVCRRVGLRGLVGAFSARAPSTIPGCALSGEVLEGAELIPRARP
eukprot:623437-Rhodomonas_salina.1